MTDKQPEALRLAAQLEDTESARLHLLSYAAAELRRQHGEIESMRAERLRTERRLSEVEKQRDELLEALKDVMDWFVDRHETDEAAVVARAAIAKVEGEKK